jgi:hypothetical protein
MFCIDRYKEAQRSQKTFLDDKETLNISSLITFSSNIECFIDTLHRASEILGKLLKDYPFYIPLLSEDCVTLQNEVDESTAEIRNKIQHIDGALIGMKARDPKKMGSIIPNLNDSSEFELGNKKIPIKFLVSWIEIFNSYSDIIANHQIELAVTEIIKMLLCQRCIHDYSYA